MSLPQSYTPTSSPTERQLRLDAQRNAAADIRKSGIQFAAGRLFMGERPDGDLGTEWDAVSELLAEDLTNNGMFFNRHIDWGSDLDHGRLQLQRGAVEALAAYAKAQVETEVPVRLRTFCDSVTVDLWKTYEPSTLVEKEIPSRFDAGIELR